jgi:hypothetical protein
MSEMFMRHIAIVMMAGLMLCTLSGCVVHNNQQEQAPIWWPAFLVQQDQTSDQWGNQSIYGSDHGNYVIYRRSETGGDASSAQSEPWMQSMPSVPAQPDM